MTTPGNPKPEPSAAAKAGAPRKTHRLGDSDYELEGKLGQGAMGKVYKAKQLSQNRIVALKLLPKDMAQDEEFLERFRREARAAMRLSHPNIVAAYDMGMAENYHYIAMEFVDGPSLELYLQRKGRLTQAEVLKVALDMSAALGEAEAHHIVHRDIKPGNILFSNSQRLNKLTDLGLASASEGDRRVTMAGYCVGTPYYVSPEQARGERDVDGRADIYSLGATLYHLATGRLPFEGLNPLVIMGKHLQEEPPAPNVREPAVSAHVSALIQKMMAKDPAKRPQNALDLRVDIERCMKGEMPLPPGVRPKPPPAEPGAPGQASPAWLDRIVASADRLLPFLPAPARLPTLALAATAAALGLLWMAIAILKH
ncbi:MAG: serine/threonine-protein kinase [Planctomycetota bacterium]